MLTALLKKLLLLGLQMKCKPLIIAFLDQILFHSMFPLIAQVLSAKQKCFHSFSYSRPFLLSDCQSCSAGHIILSAQMISPQFFSHQLPSLRLKECLGLCSEVCVVSVLLQSQIFSSLFIIVSSLDYKCYEKRYHSFLYVYFHS